MAKKVIGFSDQSDFDRMAASVRKSESTPMVGQRQRGKYPAGGGGVKVERAVLTAIGTEGVHTAFIITGGFTDNISSPNISSNLGTVSVYAGDHLSYQLEAGDPVMLAKVSGKWWIIEASQDCHGGCIDEPFPVAVPGYVSQYLWSMPALSCCPEASGVHLLPALSVASDTTWESATFQCNADGTNRKWVYDGTQLQLEPPLNTGTVKYKHVPGNSICPTKMYAFEYPAIFPSDCGPFPKTACIVPMCTRKTATSCGGFSNRNWIIAFSGGELTAATGGAYCGFLQSGTLLSAKFIGDPLTPVTDNFTPDPVDGSTAPYFYISLRLRSDPSLSTNEISLNSADAVYKIRDGANADCTGLNIFDLYSLDATPICTGYPDTIYAYPADNEFISSKCYPRSGLPMWLNSPSGSFPQLSEWNCTSTPYVVTVEFTTVANGSCSACDEFNQKFELFMTVNSYSNVVHRTYTAVTENLTECWADPFMIGDIKYYIVLVIPASGTVYLRVSTSYETYTTGSDTIWAYYELDAGTMSGWNCWGLNTFTIVSESAYCDFPSTITVRPGGA